MQSQESVGGWLVVQQRCKDAIFHCNQPAPVIQSSLIQSNLPTPLKWPLIHISPSTPVFLCNCYNVDQIVFDTAQTVETLGWPKDSQREAFGGKGFILHNKEKNAHCLDRIDEKHNFKFDSWSSGHLLYQAAGLSRTSNHFAITADRLAGLRPPLR